MTTPRSGWLARRAWIAPLSVIVAATWPYLPSVDNYFVADDFGVHQLLTSKPATYFPQWFYTSWMETIWGAYPDEVRPFPALTYQLAGWFGAGVPTTDHVINIAFHAGNGWLVLLVARRVAGLSPWASLFAALAFVLLPVHAESVAWITGRVDTIPSLFYLAAYLAYVGWRREPDRPDQYAWSLIWLFLALFSKQNTITLVGTLVLHDVLIERQTPRASWAWIRPYVPFAAMTGGYLWLRYLIFGEVAREGQLSLEKVASAGEIVARHLERVVFGHTGVGPWAMVGMAAVAFLTLWAARRAGAERAPQPLGQLLLFFGPVWWAIGVAPILVAGYESPRHVYLAAVGWAIVIGVVAQVVAGWPAAGRQVAWQRAVAVACAGVLAAYAVGLQREVRLWIDKADASHQMVQALENTADAAPPGALLIVGVSPRSWEWALPFAARPPYTASDLTTRVRIVSPQLLHCCREQWFDHTRGTIEAWTRGEPQAPVILIRWDERTTSVIVSSDADYPELRLVVERLAEIDEPHSLDRALRDALSHFVAARHAGRWTGVPTKTMTDHTRVDVPPHSSAPEPLLHGSVARG